MSTIFIILFNFVAGTLCIIFGVNLMSTGLEKANSRIMKKVLTRFTSRASTALITGTVVTALVQSSTAVTVITVGLVNSGLMKLYQAVGIIYGANIGTTITAQLMSFKLTDLALPILAAGVVFNLLSKRPSMKNASSALIGFGLMFLGINILNWGVPLIKESRITQDIFSNFGGNPYLGLAAGMVITMLVHSSSATVGLTIVLFNANLITFEAAIGVMLGDNIGTCVTAQAASLGMNISARRTAWSHTLYNTIGVLLVLVILKPFASLVNTVTLAAGQPSSRLIANAHTTFNILSAVVFLPLTKHYVRFIEWIIPCRKKSFESR